MRIIAGRWHGHRIAAPTGRDTRPTSDRVREAIFSSVYSLVGGLEGARVLDLYAGSGAMGLEALSRGASHCTFVESDARAASTIAENVTALRAERDVAVIVKERAERAAVTRLSNLHATLLLADPPYRIGAVEFSQVLEALASCGALEVGAVVVYEHSAGCEAVWPEGFEERSVRRYGDTAVSFATYEG